MKDHYDSQRPPILGEETWNLIKEYRCDTVSLLKIYCVLMNDKDKLRIVLQCLAEAHKAMIIKIVFGSSNMPS